MTSVITFLTDMGDRYQTLFGDSAPDFGEVFQTVAAPVLAAIANSDAPYHDLNHTLQVIEVGHLLLESKHRHDGDLAPADWLHTLVSLLCHDAGYVRGLCPGDDCTRHRYSDGQGGWVQLDASASDAALGPYHVDRSQQYVVTQLGHHPLLDPAILVANIEMTRFPAAVESGQSVPGSYPAFCRAADLIGQLSDRYYLQKLPNLYREFQETGLNQTLGYNSPADLRSSYPYFYWQSVYPDIQSSLRYLSMIPAGHRIIAALYANVYCVELELRQRETHAVARPRLAENTCRSWHQSAMSALPLPA